MRIFDLNLSANYARVRPSYPPELYLWLSQQVANTGVVWDCACGTGQASIDLAAYFDRVEATDLSAAQIAKATPHRKVHYSVQKSEETSFPDHYFDAICVAHALHWFDLPDFWQEVKRVLKPNGVIVVWGYHWFRLDDVAGQLVDETLLPLLKPYWPPQSRLLWTRYDDMAFPFQRIEVPDFKLETQWTLGQTCDFIRTWSATQFFVADGGQEILENFEQKLRECWGNAGDKKPVSMPFFAHAGRV
ncbi:class I SAM-dependent methyltransferase [Maribrevibacterium harenarium]|uniref:Class I SAM-dependent methyltransferase n=1 Tax=Maribrevibacterium harenarium TaxID=2589817 RepID=A0A501X2B7_9GAMM|nr:class I SAM-dependent methyltransferase [Maribrevibacterium harenarium]